MPEYSSTTFNAVNAQFIAQIQKTDMRTDKETA